MANLGSQGCNIHLIGGSTEPQPGVRGPHGNSLLNSQTPDDLPFHFEWRTETSRRAFFGSLRTQERVLPFKALSPRDSFSSARKVPSHTLTTLQVPLQTTNRCACGGTPRKRPPPPRSRQWSFCFEKTLAARKTKDTIWTSRQPRLWARDPKDTVRRTYTFSFTFLCCFPHVLPLLTLDHV